MGARAVRFPLTLHDPTTARARAGIKYGVLGSRFPSGNDYVCWLADSHSVVNVPGAMPDG